MARSLHVIMTDRQVYGVTLKRDTVFLTSGQLQMLDQFLQMPATEIAMYGVEAQAAQFALRQALGFTEAIEGQRL